MVLSPGIKTVKVIHQSIKHPINFLVCKTMEIEIDASILRSPSFPYSLSVIINMYQLAHLARFFHFSQLIGNFYFLAEPVHGIIIKRIPECAYNWKD